MSRLLRSPVPVCLAVCGALALAAGLLGKASSNDAIASHAGGMDAMSIDMDPGAAPANTATSVGSIEQCARINENGVVDADEDVEDAVEADITAEGIPAYSDNGTPTLVDDDSGGIIAFQYRLLYDESQFTIVSQNLELILTANTSSGEIFDISEPVPDNDGNNSWLGTALDTGSGLPEDGDGVIQRLALETDSVAAAGQYLIDFESGSTGHLDAVGAAQLPDSVGFANIAVGRACGPLVTPEPTQTPIPPPSGGAQTPTYLPPNPDGAMTAMRIDMDPSAAPANSATSIGSAEQCARINENGILDADEDAEDALEVDITAEGVPPYDDRGTPDYGADNFGGIIGFQFILIYDESNLTLQSGDHSFLLNANEGSSAFDLNDPTPDVDGNNYWGGVAVDGGGIPEDGSGVLERVTIVSDELASAGQSGLGFGAQETMHLDGANRPHGPKTLGLANIAIGQPCGALVTPGPGQPPVPIPTHSPYPTFRPPDPNGAMDAMSIDMDPAAAPANTATSIGSIEQCARINENGVLDGDEDAEDALEFDVTAEAIPQYDDGGTPNFPNDDTGGFIGFQYEIVYDETAFTIQSEDTGFLLDSNPASSIFEINDGSPDHDGSNSWIGSALDVGTGIPEGGDGVMQRISVSADDAVAAGQWPISFRSGNTAHLDVYGAAYQPRSVGFANIAVNQTCGPLVTPAPTPSPSPPPTPMPTPLPTPTRTPGPPDPTPCCPGGPGPTPIYTPSNSVLAFSPGGLICFEDFDASDYHPDGSVRAANECDGDPAPNAASDLRVRTCVGWNDDCTVMDQPSRDSKFDELITFIPPEFVIKPGDQYPAGSVAGHHSSLTSLGVLGIGCGLPINWNFTMLNGSINIDDTIEPRPVGTADVMAPLAADASGNGIPDGADRYPSFLRYAFDTDHASGADGVPGTSDDINGPSEPLRPRARLIGLTRVYSSWVAMQVLVFDPGVSIKGPTGDPVPLNPDLGFPAVVVFQDPTVQGAPGAISDLCSPLRSDVVFFGLTRDNPCTGGLDTGSTRGNCPSEGDNVIENAGYPLMPCENGNTLDEDQEGAVNDGCPQVNAEAETGGACNNAVSDEPEDATVNDGCPAVGDSEEIYRGSECSNADEGGCEARKNPAQGGTTNLTIYTRSLRDADEDGMDNEADVCSLKPNAEWNPAAVPFDAVHDPDGDGLPTACDPQPNDSCPRGVSPPCNSNSPSGCEKGIVGPDYDQDCYSNRADNCPLTTQLRDPSQPPSFTQGNPQPSDNTPQLSDRDRDGIGDACDITACPSEDTPGYLRADCELFGTSAKGTAFDGRGSQDGPYVVDCLGFEVTVGVGANPRASGPTHTFHCLNIVVPAEPAPGSPDGSGAPTSQDSPTPNAPPDLGSAQQTPTPTPVPAALGAVALPSAGGDGGGTTSWVGLGAAVLVALGLLGGGIFVRRRLANATIRRE